MKRHCIDCGIIFYTDDRRDEEETVGSVCGVN